MTHIQEWAATHGYATVYAATDLLKDIRAELDRRRETAEIEPRFYEENLTRFDYLDGTGTAAAKSLIVLAVPRRAFRLNFETGSQMLETIVPPTYVGYGQTSTELQRELSRLLPTNTVLKPFRAPLKLLAARLGLVRYGRNNLTYAPGMGSYHQLVAFWTDLVLEPVVQPKAASENLVECRSCQGCLKACPNGAITAERFLIRAERCLTRFNESPGSWPEWLDITAHQCLVGCLACQEACPVNSGRLRVEPAPISFTEEETVAILGEQANELEPVKAKLALLGLDGYQAVIGRNLKALIQNGSAYRHTFGAV